jgi:hypothetical protein
MEIGAAGISVKGRQVQAPSVVVNGKCIVATGWWLKIAQIRSEAYEEALVDPEPIVARLKSTRLADIFSFSQSITDPEPKYPQYYIEWDNVANILLSNYEDWWSGLSQDSRRNVRIAKKRGVEVHLVAFDDELVQGIKSIYDELPIRQGRRFWHYGKKAETVKRENSSYLQRSDFIAAHCGDELVGFIKMVYVDKVARIMQILSKNAHFDKRPGNALIAKAVEIACQKGATHLTYCRYSYGARNNSSISEFKRRNGFAELRFPRYYVPLTLKGELAIRIGLHLGIPGVLPDGWLDFLRNVRAKYYARLTSVKGMSAPESAS